MENAARKLDDELLQEVGTVTGVRGPLFDLRTLSGRFTARRAASCLRVPELGDTVLVATLAEGTSYVLQVLEATESRATLAFDGDVQLRAESGSLHLRAAEGVRITTPAEFSVLGARFDLRAIDASLAVRTLSFLGRTVRCEMEKLRSVTEVLELVAERFSQKAGRSYRTVADVDQLRAGAIDHSATDAMTLGARNTVVTAEQLLKVDAEQIHLG